MDGAEGVAWTEETAAERIEEPSLKIPTDPPVALMAVVALDSVQQPQVGGGTAFRFVLGMEDKFFTKIFSDLYDFYWLGSSIHVIAEDRLLDGVLNCANRLQSSVNHYYHQQIITSISNANWHTFQCSRVAFRCFPYIASVFVIFPFLPFLPLKTKCS